MHVGRQLDVAGDLVACFAVPPHHGGATALTQGMPVGKRDSVFRAVQRHNP